MITHATHINMHMSYVYSIQSFGHMENVPYFLVRSDKHPYFPHNNSYVAHRIRNRLLCILSTLGWMKCGSGGA